jgi:hypothetical protein
LQEIQPIPGVNIITLSEHVDYWNYLGWSDPYSSDLYSQRQKLFASQLHNSSIYTPQMIVDGRSEFVGGNYSQAVSSIKAAAELPKAYIALEAKKSGDHVDLKGKITFPDTFSAGEASLYVALVEDKLHSVVNRGENSGHTLEHSSVVRELINIGKVSVGKSIQFEKVIKVAPAWKRNNLRMIAFAQDTGNLHILGATESRLVDDGIR